MLWFKSLTLIASLFIFFMISSCGGSSPTEVQTNEPPEFTPEVFPGVGAVDVNLGDSFNKIVSIHGNPDFIASGTFNGIILSYWVEYRSLGLTFYFDGGRVPAGTPLNSGKPTDEIKMESPFSGLTPEEIGIGSPETDVVTAYGVADTTVFGLQVYEMLGIKFKYNESSIVEEMRVF